MDCIYVFGHKNPDTDSIVSAMAYTALQNAAGIQLMPYHKLGQGKTTRYGAKSEEFRVPTGEEIAGWNRMLKEAIGEERHG